MKRAGEQGKTTGCLTLPAKISSLNDVFDLVHAELRRRGCPPPVRNQIDIALEELFVNVCHYAYADKGEPGNCIVSYVFIPVKNSIEITFIDTGIPFNPLTRKDPTKPSSIQDARIGGLGIYMTKKSVDEITYERRGNQNVVTFSKGW